MSLERIAVLSDVRGNWDDFLPRTPSDASEDMVAATDLTGDGATPDLVGYGDIHAVYVEERDGRTLFNVGSVGNPLDEPVPSYVVLSGELGSADEGPFGVEVARVDTTPYASAVPTRATSRV